MINISYILQLLTLWFVILVFIQTDTPTSNDLIMLLGPIADLLLLIIPLIILIIFILIFK
jgi:hypothetical protein